MPGKLKRFGTQYDIKRGFIKINGTHRELKAGYHKVNGTWTQIFSSALTRGKLDDLLYDYMTAYMASADPANDADVQKLEAKVVNANVSKITDFSSLGTKPETASKTMTAEHYDNFNADISLWDTSAATNMFRMFRNMKIFNQDISGWNTSNVVNMSSMFNSARAFNQDISGWDTSNVVNMSYMFSTASEFNQNLSTWNVEKVTNMSYMFEWAVKFNNGQLAGISTQPLAWTTSALTTTAHMFNTAQTFNQDVSSFVMDNVVASNHMFASASLFNQDLSAWNTANIENMSFMFNSASKFNSPLFLDVSSVTDMSGMFNNAQTFNQDISSWNTSNVTTMSRLFANAYRFNQDISSWDTTNVASMIKTFENATDFNKPLDTWNVRNAITKDYMFNGASSFNQDLNSWDMSQTVNAGYMFQNAATFNGNIVNWDMTSTVAITGMFQGAVSFNQPIGKWDTRNIRDFTNAFNGAIEFNQPLGCWRFDSVVNSSAFFYMFLNATKFSQNLRNWCIPGAATRPVSFANGTPMTAALEPDWGNMTGCVPGLAKGENIIAIFDMTDASNMFQDEAMTIPVVPNNTTNGATVRAIRDISGNNNHAVFRTWTGGANSASAGAKLDTITGVPYILQGPSVYLGIPTLPSTSVDIAFLIPSVGSTFFEQNSSTTGSIYGAASAKRTTAYVVVTSRGSGSTVSGLECKNNYDGLEPEMSHLFRGTTTFNEDISDWDTSRVKDMEYVFERAKAFNQDISSWDVSNVTTMGRMFQDAEAFNQKLAPLDGSGWNTASLRNTEYMFAYTDVFNGDIQGLNTSKITNMSNMFLDAKKFNQDLITNGTSWDVSNVVTAQSVFSGALEFNGRLDGWNTAKMTNMSYFLYNAKKFNQPLTTVSDVWNVSNNTNFYQFFYGTDVFNQDLNSWVPNKGTKFGGMFQKALAFNNGQLNGINTNPLTWDTSSATDMSSMFYQATSLGQDINIITTNVTNMSSMFERASVFNGDVSNFETHNVTNMSRMFAMATAFNQDLLRGKGGNPNVWNTSKVGTYTTTPSFTSTMTFVGCFKGMFNGATAFNGDISNWYTHNAYNFSEMFWDAASFNRHVNTGGVANDDPNIWNMSKADTVNNKFVNGFYSMFRGATNFNQPLDRWDVSNVRVFSHMFNSASIFNQDISLWDVSNGGSMIAGYKAANQAYSTSQDTYLGFHSMFNNATSFNQKLGCWNFSGVEASAQVVFGDGYVVPQLEFRSMFNGATNFTQDISSWCTPSFTVEPLDFATSSGISGVTAKNPQWAAMAGCVPGAVSGDNVLAIFDFGDYSNLFSDAAMTNNLTAPATLLAAVRDISGNNNHLLMRNSTNASLDYGQIVEDANGKPYMGSNSTYLHIPTLANTAVDVAFMIPSVGAGVYTTTTNAGGLFAGGGNVPSFGYIVVTAAGSGTSVKGLGCVKYTITAPSISTANLFRGTYAPISDLSSFNMTNVTDANSMFYQNATFNGPEIAGWDMSNVTDVSNMFRETTSFNQDLSSWDMTSVSFMGGMFQSATAFNNGETTDTGANPLTWTTPNLTTITRMFNGASKFNQSVNTFNTDLVTSFSQVFSGASKFNQPLSSWNTSSSTNFYETFANCSKFNQDLNTWDVSKGATFSYTFSNCLVFNGDVENWDVSSAFRTNYMFSGCSKFNRNLSSWVMTKNTNMGSMMQNCVEFNNGELAGISTTPLTWTLCTTDLVDMFNVFNNCQVFNQEVNSWDMSKVSRINNLFMNCFAFNKPVNNWQLPEVTVMSSAFSNAREFNQNVSSWVLPKCTHMDKLFSGANKFNNGDVSPLTINAPLLSIANEVFKDAYEYNAETIFNSTNITNMAQMFYRAYKFNNGESAGASNKPLILNTSNVTNMLATFGGARDFNQPIGDWDTSSVTNMAQMFESTTTSIITVFNQPIGDWDVSKVTQMQNMFDGAKGFNQPIGCWKLNSINNMGNMFKNSVFNQNISGWCTPNVTTEPTGFSSGGSLTLGNSPQWSTMAGCTPGGVRGSNVLGIYPMNTYTSMFNDEAMTIPTPVGATTTKAFADTSGNNNPMFIRNSSNVSQSVGVFRDDNTTPYIGSWSGYLVIPSLAGQTVDMAILFPTVGAVVIESITLDANGRLYGNTSALPHIGYVVVTAAGSGSTVAGLGCIKYSITTPSVLLQNAFSGFDTFNSDVSHFNTSKVTRMDGMFKGCLAFNNGDAAGASTKPLNWDTSNVAYMQNMFENAYVFNQDISTWDTSKVDSMSSMFKNAKLFDQPIGNWNTSTARIMSGMFEGASVFNQKINFDFSKVTSTGLQYFLKNARKWNNGSLTDDMANPIDWNITTAITSYRELFAFCKLFNQNVNALSNPAVTNYTSMFKQADIFNNGKPDNDTTAPILWDTTNATTMSEMFAETNLTQSVELFKTSNVTNMFGMFYFTPYNQPLKTGGPLGTDPAVWDVSKVQNFWSTFSIARDFNQDLSSWDTSSATNMKNMFGSASGFNNGEVAGLSTKPLTFNTSLVTDMESMFSTATVFNQDISSWDTSKVTTMKNMFVSALAFDQPIGSWDTSLVTTMVSMFNNADAFKQPIGDWDVSKVTAFTSMFMNTNNFNQPLGCWRPSSATNMDQMFLNANSFNQNISGWCVPNITTEPSTFSTGSILDLNNKPDWANMGSCNPNTIVRGTGIIAQFDFGDLNNVFSDDAGTVPMTGIGAIRAVGDISGNGNDLKIVNSATGTTSTTTSYKTTSDTQYYAELQTGKYMQVSALANQVVDVVILIPGVGVTVLPNLTLNAQGTIYGGSSNIVSIGYVVVTTAGNGYTVTGLNCIKYTGTFTPSVDGLFSNLSTFNEPVSHLNMSRVTSLQSVFRNASAFNQHVDTWDTSNVTTFKTMFDGATNFDQPVGSWNTSSAVDMSFMFNNARNFNQPIDTWDVANVTNFNAMFSNAKLFDQPLSSWITSSAVDMSSMFSWTNAFNGDITTWNTSEVTNMSSMFAEAFSFNQDISSWTTSKVTNMSGMFRRAKLFNQPIGIWDTSKVTNMSSMFNDAYVFNQDLSTWDVGNVTNMSSMFRVASAFNQPLNSWNVSSVTNMSNMFNNATVFNEDVTSWDVSNVTNMSNMFSGASVFNQDIGGWVTDSATDMSFMFSNASAFNQPIGNWNVSGVTTMSFMFNSTTAFNQDISNWDTSNVTNMTYMFNATSVFDQPIGRWNVSKVTNMSRMFRNAAVFNQPLECWNTASATDMTYMFQSASAFNQDLSGWCTPNITVEPTLFADNSPINGTAKEPDWANMGSCDPTGVSIKADTIHAQYDMNDMSTLWTDVVGGTNVTAHNQTVKAISDISGNGRHLTVAGVGRYWVGSDGVGFVRLEGNSWFQQTDMNLDTDIGIVYGGIGAFVVERDATTSTKITEGVPGESTYYGKMIVVPRGTTISGLGCQPYKGVTTTSYMSIFAGYSDVKTDITNLSLDGIITTSSMFRYNKRFNQDISGWDTSSVTNMSYMFDNTLTFNQDISSWNTSSVTNMISMFNKADAFDQPIGTWNTSRVTSMNSMFFSAKAFNQPIGSWDTAKVTDMYGMFQNAIVFNQAIGSWNVEKVTNMSYMFSGASVFNQDISTWVTTSITTISSMFQNAKKFNQPIGSWNMSKVTNLYNMFSGATDFDQDISGWNTSLVTNMSGTFRLSNFNKDISAWDTTKVATMYQMFDRAPLFNQPIGSWNTSSVTNMSGMFASASAFNQPLECWNVSSVTDMSRMFVVTTAFNQNISSWCTPSITSEPFDFSTLSALDSANKPDWANMTGCTFTPCLPVDSTLAYAHYDAAVLSSMALNPDGTGGTPNPGDKVAYIADLSGNGRHASQTNVALQPTYRETASGQGYLEMSELSYFTAPSLPSTTSVRHYVSLAGRGVVLFHTIGISTYRRRVGMKTNTSTPDKVWAFKEEFVLSAANPVVEEPTRVAMMRATKKYAKSTQASLKHLFRNEIELKTGLSDFDVSGVATLEGMMYNTSDWGLGQGEDINGWDLTGVTDMTSLFRSSKFNNGGVPFTLDCSNITNMSYMFQKGGNITVDVSEWAKTTGNVTNMEGMFYQYGFETVPGLGDLNTSSVTNMSSMFAYSTFNQNISAWDVSKVEKFVQMFTGIILGGVRFNNGSTTDDNANPLTWDVSSGVDFSWMFAENPYFNQDISSWVFKPGVNIDMKSMFEKATAFNTPIPAWDLSMITSSTQLGSFLQGATSFDQDISGWCVPNVGSNPNLFASDAPIDGTAKMPGWGTCP